jgi:hypothetical protein
MKYIRLALSEKSRRVSTSSITEEAPIYLNSPNGTEVVAGLLMINSAY